ncbi:hypothetical protein GCM10027421_00700 [Microbacterium shaanxiense]
MPASTRARRLIPVGLRLSALGMRFLLIFFLARLLPVEDVGLYSLLLATISFVVFIFGFDFYTYSTRQIIRDDGRQRRAFIRSQAVLSVILYGVVSPILVVLFATGFLPWHTLGWFLGLAIVEHIGLEIDRLLIAMHDQFGASMGMFIRQGCTSLVAVPLMLMEPALRTLDFLLATWFAFDVLGILVGWLYLRRHLREHPVGKVRYSWILTGVKMALPFLIGTLCLRGLFTFDRQIVAATAGLAILGTYGLFMSLGSGMTQVLNAGVQQFAYPRLVAAAHAKSASDFTRALRSLNLQTLVGVTTISLAVVAASPLLLRFVGGDAYEQQAWMLPWVMLVNAIYNVSLVPHYALYALDADRAILLSTVGALALFALVVVLLIRIDVVVAVLAALGSACAMLLIVKSAVYFSRRKRVGWL